MVSIADAANGGSFFLIWTIMISHINRETARRTGNDYPSRRIAHFGGLNERSLR